MARIRSVKPELRRDLTVAEWPREARYAFVLLWGYLDDEGRGLDDLRLLVADLFPLDRDVTEKKLNGWITRMAEDGPHGPAPLCRYQIGTRNYLHAPKWNRSQRVSHPQESRIPPCPIHEPSPIASGTTPDSFPNDSGIAPERFTPSRTPEVQGVKGSRDQGPETAAPPEPPATPTGPKRTTSAPDIFPITDVMAAWGRTHAPLVLDPKTETGQFLDYHRAKGSTFKDWTAAWRTWMTNAQKYAVRDGGKPPALNDPSKEYLRSW